MAPSKVNKEAIIIAIDIGKNSSLLDSDGKNYFEKSLFCASMILKRKLLSESKDDLALILFGSSQTNNHLSSQGNFFNNIEIVSSLGVVTWDLLQFVTNLSSTDITPSDWISAIVIALDMLKNDNDNKIYTELQIVVFSNFTDVISFDKIDSITNCIKNLYINLTMIGKNYEDITLNPQMEKFILETNASAVDFDAVLPQLSHYKTKEVTPKAWNVPLSFANVFSIKVSGYKKVDETPKGFKWLLCKKHDTPDSITGLQKHISYYYIDNNVQKEVDRDSIIFGFRYGDKIIPVSDIDTDAYGYKSGPKSLQVFGFTKSKNIRRSFLMDGGTYIFKPDKISDDFVAFNALFKAMVEMEVVMIVRKVYMMNCMPNIGAMFPQSEDGENYFVFANLPFAEDEHLFKLPSLKVFKPNDEQNNAVCNFINAMDLDENEDESFTLENKFSPDLQLMYDCIAQSAINKSLNTIVPENIQNLLRPPKIIMEKAKQPINELKKLFLFASKTDEKDKVKDNTLNHFKTIEKTSTSEHNEELKIEKPCIIREYNPVEDFNTFLKDGFDSDIVCQTMKKLTVNLIESSTSLEELQKPASNLKALRQFYIHNNDVNSYNNWMYHVKDSVLLSGKEKLWSQFIDSGIGLITNQEIDISDISQELSEEFMKHETNEDVVAEFSIDDDDPMKEFLNL